VVGRFVLRLAKVALDQLLKGLDCLKLIRACGTDRDLGTHGSSKCKQVENTLGIGLNFFASWTNRRAGRA